ncbi:GntR family transcriptional regulator [Clostridium frigidicarnis]|uniref:DNA-binding transcriptional regulator YhcF, GntR family n=1 Tax=Clostridium frigidicarnis TaxID=84698 RepID=A0A1I0Z3P6_9CLOT|nr:GntR family transcriptional regulator [Clostridium frigidicarnis]SFB20235.1 DNA-binding transcriptional regulator YhcF, GntR family [Clostridium frigidicarnis]
MEIIVTKNNGIPLYLQVKKQIMHQIRSGSLKVGDKMPTERELAEKLSVSRNTVSTAYKELEKEGVLKSYQGKGTFIAEEGKTWQNHNIKEKIMKFADLALEEALQTGMSIDEFIYIVESRVREKVEQMNKMVAIYVECNIEQAKMFANELHNDTHMNVKPLTLTDIRNMSYETRVALDECQLIISTFNHVNEVIRLTSEFNKDVLGVAINADLGTIVKVARYPNDTKFGFFCISEEFMFKIQGALESAGLDGINITYSNTRDVSEIQKIIDNSDVIIVSPGRYKNIMELNRDNKEIIKFIYSLDDGSVKALKSKLIEFQM